MSKSNIQSGDSSGAGGSGTGAGGTEMGAGGSTPVGGVPMPTYSQSQVCISSTLLT